MNRVVNQFFAGMPVMIVFMVVLAVAILGGCASTPKANANKAPVQASAITTNEAVDTSTVKFEDSPEEPEPEPTPEIQIQEQPDRSHEVKTGESLWRIAEYEHVYNNPLEWRRIHNANKNIIDNPDLIYPDQRFIIPPIEQDFELE